MFVVFEGPDGVGKTTAIKMLKDVFLHGGVDAVFTREPGGTSIADKLRNIIVSKNEAEKLVPLTELLLAYASRLQHIEHVIKPNLEQHKVVVTDRYNYSSHVYQGILNDISVEVMELEKLLFKEEESLPTPDLVINCTAPLEVVLQRLSNDLTKTSKFDTCTDSVIRVYNSYRNMKYENARSVVNLDMGRDEKDIKLSLHDIFFRRKSDTKAYV